MRRSVALAVACVAAASLPAALRAQKSAMIENALSAAPPSISGKATIMDWNQSVVRPGSNGWTCYPDFPGTPGNDPMCLDQPWMEWAKAYMGHSPLKVSRMGFGYMLGGDSPASNVDPYASGPTEDNEWLPRGHPHIMIVVPDAAMLQGLPVRPQGGPWVMWRNTPYVHVMVPITDQSGPVQLSRTGGR